MTGDTSRFRIQTLVQLTALAVGSVQGAIQHGFLGLLAEVAFVEPLANPPVIVGFPMSPVLRSDLFFLLDRLVIRAQVGIGGGLDPLRYRRPSLARARRGFDMVFGLAFTLGFLEQLEL